jgi:hypothetical protein
MFVYWFNAFGGEVCKQHHAKVGMFITLAISTLFFYDGGCCDSNGFNGMVMLVATLVPDIVVVTVR